MSKIGIAIGLLAAFGLGLTATTRAEETAAHDAPASEQSDRPLTVEEILARDPSREDYVEDHDCLSQGRIKQVEVIDNQHVAFRMGRDQYYLVQFERPCIDLRRGEPVFLERHMSRLCKHDVIRGVISTGVGGVQRGMMCRIPGFQSVSKEQVVMLKSALKAERRKGRAKG